MKAEDLSPEQLAALKAKFGPAPERAEDLSPDQLQALRAKFEPQTSSANNPQNGFIEPGPAYAPPQTSLGSQAATVLMKGGSYMPFFDETVGAIDGGMQTLGEKTGLLPPSGNSLRQNVNNSIDSTREVINGLSAANPGSSKVGDVAGFAGSVYAGGGSKMLQAGMGAAQMAGAADNGSPLERGLYGAAGALLPTAVNAAGRGVSAVGRSVAESGAVKSAIQATKGLGARGLEGMQSALSRLGFDASEIRLAAQQVTEGVAGKENPVVQLKLLADSGVLKGAKSTVEVNKALESTIKKVASDSDAIVDKIGAKTFTPPTALNSLPWDENHVAAKGLDRVTADARSFLASKIPMLLDESGNIKSLDLKQAREIRRFIDANRSSFLHTDTTNIAAHSLDLVGDYLRDSIENASPEIAKNNAIVSAALALKGKTIPLENKAVDVGASKLKQALQSRIVATGVGGLAGHYGAQALGLDPLTGTAVGMGAGLGMKVMNAPQSLPNSLNMLNEGGTVLPALGRSLEHIGDFASKYGNALPAGAAAFLQQYKNLPADQQEKMGPAVLQEAKALGIPVQESSTGYQSEFNGKITDPAERNQAALSVFKKAQTGGMSYMDAAMQVNAINANGTIPQSLVKAAPPVSSPVRAPIPESPAPTATAPTNFEDIVKVFRGK